MNEQREQAELKHDEAEGLSDGVSKPLFKVDVRGAHEITFEEGWRTGGMTEWGVSIKTVYWADNKRIYGGCIDREEAKQLRDFLNECLAKWEEEKAC
jgi:hypothetical protein